MTYPTFNAARLTLHNDRVRAEDAARQMRAAEEILIRLRHQPGVILADEVGMGKTFVALAVSMSILLQRPDDGPVVVMSPPSLRHKWPKDWNVFLDKCVKHGRERFRAATADSGVDFLRLGLGGQDKAGHLSTLQCRVRW
jgi:SNF2 family DNA or RNA helicase